MIVYKQNEVFVAAGYLRNNQTVLHCHDVPNDHVCVLISTTKEGIEAPLVLGDSEENLFLQKGMIFALPKQFLYRPSLGQNTSVNLVPYTG